MFSFVTIYNATTLDLQFLSFIDNQGFPGVENVSPPGPLGYQQFIYSEAIGIVPEVMWLLNTVRTTSAEGSSSEGLRRDAQNTSQAMTRE